MRSGFHHFPDHSWLHTLSISMLHVHCGFYCVPQNEHLSRMEMLSSHYDNEFPLATAATRAATPQSASQHPPIPVHSLAPPPAHIANPVGQPLASTGSGTPQNRTHFRNTLAKTSAKYSIHSCVRVCVPYVNIYMLDRWANAFGIDMANPRQHSPDNRIHPNRETRHDRASAKRKNRFVSDLTRSHFFFCRYQQPASTLLSIRHCRIFHGAPREWAEPEYGRQHSCHLRVCVVCVLCVIVCVVRFDRFVWLRVHHTRPSTRMTFFNNCWCWCPPLLVPDIH